MARQQAASFGIPFQQVLDEHDFDVWRQYGNLSALLRMLRRELGLNQTEMAEELGSAVATVIRLGLESYGAATMEG